MGYGPVAFSTSQSVDNSAPGAPTFSSIVQPDGQDDIFLATLRLPETDANGNPITGLTKLAVYTTIRDGDVNPYEGKSMDEIQALPIEQRGVIQDLDPAVNIPGSEVTLNQPIMRLGSTQQFAAACTDA